MIDRTTKDTSEFSLSQILRVTSVDICRSFDGLHDTAQRRRGGRTERELVRTDLFSKIRTCPLSKKESHPWVQPVRQRLSETNYIVPLISYRGKMGENFFLVIIITIIMTLPLSEWFYNRNPSRILVGKNKVTTEPTTICIQLGRLYMVYVVNVNDFLNATNVSKNTVSEWVFGVPNTFFSKTLNSITFLVRWHTITRNFVCFVLD